MCNICESLIFDIIVDPLPAKHILNDYIRVSGLKNCAREVAHCFSRALNVTPDSLTKYHTSLNSHCAPYLEDERIWNAFHTEFPTEASELEHAITLCMESSVTVRTSVPEQLIKHFFMHKLRTILRIIPSTHHDHTVKLPPVKAACSRSLEAWELNRVRDRAGLPRILSSDPHYTPIVLTLPSWITM
jgi:hypothetical protein